MSTRPRLPTTVIERLEAALALLLDNEADLALLGRFGEKYENPTLLGAVCRTQGRLAKIERYIRECRQCRPEGVKS